MTRPSSTASYLNRTGVLSLSDDSLEFKVTDINFPLLVNSMVIPFDTIVACEPIHRGFAVRSRQGDELRFSVYGGFIPFTTENNSHLTQAWIEEINRHLVASLDEGSHIIYAKDNFGLAFNVLILTVALVVLGAIAAGLTSRFWLIVSFGGFFSLSGALFYFARHMLALRRFRF